MSVPLPMVAAGAATSPTTTPAATESRTSTKTTMTMTTTTTKATKATKALRGSVRSHETRARLKISWSRELRIAVEVATNERNSAIADSDEESDIEALSLVLLQRPRLLSTIATGTRRSLADTARAELPSWWWLLGLYYFIWMGTHRTY
ncbi:hypothetical protein MYCTH_2108644 [Thermothelomyces thermophilus ATCC 42464]|uniref:Uncharacterized protein n=1 Tax=Thermothelomyces thermophilus (strain ATCC 42464 / BCRC 31852 / DSM 1799) TaxID=573729 RepID=G2Q7N3_THET4|nr:uncharacterized protein MYCTH_2108644 [Thermothelomyces thermophilus ATCC 42464]AEO56091.1 hypothetical protein MYCTH_2108644 [Thermothelomyces thermophilus ATCC 42464]